MGAVRVMLLALLAEGLAAAIAGLTLIGAFNGKGKIYFHNLSLKKPPETGKVRGAEVLYQGVACYSVRPQAGPIIFQGIEVDKTKFRRSPLLDTDAGKF